MEELKMLTREEVAELLHVHVNTISMLREVGIIYFINIIFLSFFDSLFTYHSFIFITNI